MSQLHKQILKLVLTAGLILPGF